MSSGSHNGLENDQMITRGFISQMQKRISEAGINAKAYSGQSFRTAAAIYDSGMKGLVR